MNRTKTNLVILTALILTTGGACAQESSDVSIPVVSQTVTVSEAVNIALKNNPSIQSRQSIIRAAQARVEMQRAMTGPQVSASVFASTSNMPMILPGPPDVEPQNLNLTGDNSKLTTNVMAMMPLYNGGKLRERVTSAQALAKAAASDLRLAELDTALSVKTAYYRALLAQGYIVAYEYRVRESQERVRIAEESYAAGRIARYDLLRNQTDLAEAQQQLNNARKEYEMAVIELKSMMGVSLESALKLDQTESSTTVPALTELQTAAMSQRPEIEAIRARIRSAQADVAVAKSAYRPQVYAMAMADLSVSSDAMDGNTDTGYLLGVTASLPVFDNGLRRSSLNEATAMLDQMRADERETLLNISANVASAYVQYTTAVSNAELSKAAVTQAEEDYRIIRLRYEAGKAINVEVLDALANLTRMQTMYTERLYERNIAQETVTRSIGKR